MNKRYQVNIYPINQTSLMDSIEKIKMTSIQKPSKKAMKLKFPSLFYYISQLFDSQCFCLFMRSCGNGSR